MITLKEIFYTRLLNRSFKKLLKEGVVPTYQKTVDRLRGILGRDKEGAALDPVLVKDGSVFPVDGFNKNLEDIEFDLENLFDGSMYLAEHELQHALRVHEEVRYLGAQASRLAEEAERELLIAGSNFLDGTVIRFNTLEHIDTQATNAIINLEDGYAVLSTRGGTRRVVPREIPRGPTEVETKDQDGTVLPGSQFRSVFSDGLGHWQIHTLGDYVRLRLNLKHLYRFNRFRIDSPDNGMEIDLRLSRDGLNFVRPKDRQMVRNQHANFFFEELQSKFIELELRKPLQNEVDGNVFTLLGIAMYTSGHTTSNDVVTKTLKPENRNIVRLVSIDTDAEVPQDTGINIYVAPVNTSGVEGEWRKLTSRIIDMTKVSTSRRDFSVNETELFSSSPVLGSPAARGLNIHASYRSSLGVNDVWGIDVSNIFPAGVPSNVDEKSLKLYRVNNWKVDTQSVNESVEVMNRLAMEREEKRKLYVQVNDESHSIDTATQDLELNREVIEGQHVVLTDSEDAQIVRAFGVIDPAVNNDAVLQGILLILGEGQSKQVTFNATLPAFARFFDRLYVDGVGEVDIVNVDLARNRIFLDTSIDYSNAVKDSSFPIGLTEVRLQSRNLMPLIQTAIGRTVQFSDDLLPGERVTITYNSPLRRIQEDVISGSLSVVSSLDTSVSGILGLDYRIRQNEIELLPTTRFPAQPNSNVHPISVRFNYTRAVAGATTYTVWCHVPDGANRVVNIAQPIRTFNTEEVKWMNPRGRTVDLDGLENLTFDRGWHRFTVVGSRAITEGGDINQASALWQLLNLESAGGSFLFRKEDGYFDEITGFRDPMLIASRFYLEHQAVQNETDKFAWEDGSIMSLLRMDQPNDTVRLIPGVIEVQDATDYRLEYMYHEADGVHGVKVRAELIREPGSVSSLTPVLRALTIRYT
jgi:hypothetical protein